MTRDPTAIAPVIALAHLAPDFLAQLSEAERLVLPYLDDLWLRPEQRIPSGDWRYYGFICGRGFGKSEGIAREINRRVRMGEAKHVGLMAPTEDRVDEVQLSFLIATAPPWFKPERYKDGLRWPNGVTAIGFTPKAPGRPRSENLDLTWLTEIVDWDAAPRFEAFSNITTATRVGRRPQVLWDTTSQGANDVIEHLLELHENDPATYPMQRGTTFDNPLLRATYLKAECAKYAGQRYREEMLGEIYGRAAGALWSQDWIDDNRVDEAPPLELVVVGADPGLSGASTSDECGIIVSGRAVSRRPTLGDAYHLADLSLRGGPEQWGDAVIRGALEYGAAGCVVERNHLGDHATYVIRSRAREWAQRTGQRLDVRVLGKSHDGKPEPFPMRTPGVLYVREVVAASSKTTRASGPAAETQAGRVHHVGRFPELERELTTYVPGASKSPNRYDAATYNILELRELAVDGDNTAEAEAAVEGAAVMAKALAERLGSPSADPLASLRGYGSIGSASTRRVGL